ncbi:MAG: glycine cleavage system protein GcvH [Propionibacteriaceae bacterium]|nr:glycine cleavage system protein GcvH [Propionibacteriaceae bacterium]
MLKYTPEHEWLDTSDAEVAVGITAHATEQLGDIVYIELPEVDTEVSKGDEVVVIDSSKAASGICAPVDGVITAVNAEIVEHPELVNEDPAAQWFFRIRPANIADLDELLDEDAYQALIG